MSTSKLIRRFITEGFGMVFPGIPNPDWDFPKAPGIRDLATKVRFALTLAFRSRLSSIFLTQIDLIFSDKKTKKPRVYSRAYAKNCICLPKRCVFNCK